MTTMFKRTAYSVTFINTVPVSLNCHLLYHRNILHESSWTNVFKMDEFIFVVVNCVNKI